MLCGLILELSTDHLSPKSVAYLNKPPTLTRNRGAVKAEAIKVDLQSTAGRIYTDSNLDAGGRFHRWIEGGGGEVIALPHRHGWLVRVTGEIDDVGVPADLRKIVLTAHQWGMSWIDFDGDAAPGDLFETFEPPPAAPAEDLELRPTIRKLLAALKGLRSAAGKCDANPFLDAAKTMADVAIYQAEGL